MLCVVEDLLVDNGSEWFVDGCRVTSHCESYWIDEPLEEAGCTSREINAFMTACVHVMCCIVFPTLKHQTTVLVNKLWLYL